MIEAALHIAGEWLPIDRDLSMHILNPATGEIAGRVARATPAQIASAIAAGQKGFRAWRDLPAFDRSRKLRDAGAILRDRAPAISAIMSEEQGKPLAEARGEVLSGADIIDWFAEEGRRTYGRIVPARAAGISQHVVQQPIGIVAAFTPWNFPVNQAVRKISVALAAGCAVILKGPEETPGSCAELVRAFADAGLPPGTLNLLFGDPAEISRSLVTHPAIRKVSFTGSTLVGKTIAALAGAHMKPVTMELGGHAPALVFADADIDQAANRLAAAKFRNAGQVCVAPTRFLVEQPALDRFTRKMVEHAEAIVVGDGREAGTTMGPLANARRRDAVSELVDDAVAQGARILTGGRKGENRGFFYPPTILADVPLSARIMHEEPFGPVVPIRAFTDPDEAFEEANRLPYGLAAYLYSGSAALAARAEREIECGMISINHQGLGLPELPFGGVKDSGFGSEGGTEAMLPYMIPKLVTASTC